MLRQVIELLGGARRAAVVTHRRADADALACAKVLQLVLERLGVTVAAVVCPEGPQLEGCTGSCQTTLTCTCWLTLRR